MGDLSDAHREPAPGVTAKERALLNDALATALVQLGLVEPSDALLAPLARVLYSLSGDKGDGHAATK